MEVVTELNELPLSLNESNLSHIESHQVTTGLGKLVLSSGLISSNLTVMADFLLFLVQSCSLDCFLVNFDTLACKFGWLASEL